MRWRIFSVALAMGFATSAICAQEQPPVQGSPQPRPQRAAQRPENYRAYWPGSCVEAFTRSDAFYRREGADTTRFTVARDSTLPAVAAVARECAANFSIATVNPRDLVLLARTFLVAGDTLGAHTAIARRLAVDAAKPADIRAETLRDIVSAYASTRLALVPVARDYLARLDALPGEATARSRFSAHAAMARLFYRRGDTANVTAQSEAMIAAGKQMSALDRAEYTGSILSAYDYLSEIAGIQTGTSAAPLAVLARARADLGTPPEYAWAMAARDSVASLYGTVAAPVRAQYWMPAGDSLHPAKGKPSLVVFNADHENTPALRRIAALGVDITVVRGNRGHFDGRGPLDAESEARALREYYANELAIPGALAITVSEYDRLPDTRRVRRESVNEVAYRTRSGVWAVLTDRNGVIRRVFSRWYPWTELRIEEALRAVQ